MSIKEDKKYWVTLLNKDGVEFSVDSRRTINVRSLNPKLFKNSDLDSSFDYCLIDVVNRTTSHSLIVRGLRSQVNNQIKIARQGVFNGFKLFSKKKTLKNELREFYEKLHLSKVFK